MSTPSPLSGQSLGELTLNITSHNNSFQTAIQGLSLSAVQNISQIGDIPPIFYNTLSSKQVSHQISNLTKVNPQMLEQFIHNVSSNSSFQNAISSLDTQTVKAASQSLGATQAPYFYNALNSSQLGAVLADRNFMLPNGYNFVNAIQQNKNLNSALSQTPSAINNYNFFAPTPYAPTVKNISSEMPKEPNNPAQETFS